MGDEIDIALHGLPETTPSGEAFDDVIFDAVSGAVESIPPNRRKDEELVMRAAEKSIRAAARDHWGKKPMVTVFVAKV
jgi:ribonuclease J